MPWKPAFSTALAALALTILGCGRPPEPATADAALAGAWRGSVVVISSPALRADHVGALGGPQGLTPEIDRFAAESAAWRGAAVATSSDPLPALASFFTGVDPWQHQVLGPQIARLNAGLPSLAEVYWRAGYDTVLFAPPTMRLGAFQLEKGFLRSARYREADVVRELALFDDFPRFYWVLPPETDVPYRRREQDFPSLAVESADLPEILDAADLFPYADPARPMPPALSRATRALYRQQVLAADAAIGRLLAAFRRSSAWENSVVVVTGLVGTDLGEHGQVLYSQNLGRESIEVPLLIKWPAGLPPLPKARPWVAAPRLWATLVEAMGGAPAPVHLPGLRSPSTAPMLSALYRYDSGSRFSAVVAAGGGAEQVFWESRFLPVDPDFYRLQAASAGAPAAGLDPPSPAELESRAQAFSRAMPLRGERTLHGERWPAYGRPDRLDDPERLERLAAQLERAFQRFAGAERGPAAQSALPAPAGREKVATAVPSQGR
jgi:arylsulfatase A-like enzyme